MYRCAISPRVSQCAIAITFALLSHAVAGCSSEKTAEPTSDRTLSAGEPELARSSVRYSQLGVPPSIKARTEAIGVAVDRAMESPLGGTRMVVKTATIECEVANCDSTTAEIERLVTRKRGYIVSSTVRNRDAAQQTGVVVLRVPVQDFEATLAEVKTLVNVLEGEDVRGEDVTEEFIDLTARLENKRKAEQRFLEILKVARKAPEVLEIEQALMGVREEIERLEGRKRYLAHQADLSTINVMMHEPVPVMVTRVDSFWNKMMHGLGRGAERGLDRIIGLASATVVLLMVGIPFVLGVALAVWLLVRTYRKLKPRAAAEEATSA